MKDVYESAEETTQINPAPEPEDKNLDDNAIEGGLVIAAKPKKSSYAPGERIALEGLAITREGIDVTEECELSVDEGSAWAADWKTLDVRVTYEDTAGWRYITTLTLRRKRNVLVPILLAIAGVALLVAALSLVYSPEPVPLDEGETGTYLIPQEGMTADEARAMLDEMVERSRITVNLAPSMILSDSWLRVNFIVPDPNNGLSEQLEVVQDGKVVYRTGVVEPGKFVEWGEAADAAPGPAVATVYAVEGGHKTGNPVSVEVEIVEKSADK